MENHKIGLYKQSQPLYVMPNQNIKLRRPKKDQLPKDMTNSNKKYGNLIIE